MYLYDEEVALRIVEADTGEAIEVDGRINLTFPTVERYLYVYRERFAQFFGAGRAEALYAPTGLRIVTVQQDEDHGVLQLPLPDGVKAALDAVRTGEADPSWRTITSFLCYYPSM